jgi:hypothetical protein
MAITCQDIAIVADGLLAFGGEPADRSAVSRHFYAAFHRSVQWKDALPGMAGSGGYAGGTHQQLLNQLRAPDSQCTTAQKLRSKFTAAKLEILKFRRVVADYQLTAQMLASEVQMQKTQAASLMTELDANP